MTQVYSKSEINKTFLYCMLSMSLMRHIEITRLFCFFNFYNIEITKPFNALAKHTNISDCMQ